MDEQDAETKYHWLGQHINIEHAMYGAQAFFSWHEEDCQEEGIIDDEAGNDFIVV